MPVGGLIVAKWLFDIGCLALLSVVLLPASQTQAAPPQAVRAASQVTHTGYVLLSLGTARRDVIA